MTATMTPAEALEAWATHPRLPQILRACHPSLADLDLLVSSRCDLEDLGMITVCAIAAGRPVRVVADGSGQALLDTVQQIARYAKPLGRTLVPEMHARSVLVRWELTA